MKKDNYGVWEVTVQPLDSGVCAIPHDSKVKVICSTFKLRLFSFAPDLNDSSIWSAYRAFTSLDQARYTGFDRFSRLRRSILESLYVRKIRIQTPSTSQTNKHQNL